jgi:subtilase family serine protease
MRFRPAAFACALLALVAVIAAPAMARTHHATRTHRSVRRNVTPTAGAALQAPADAPAQTADTPARVACTAPPVPAADLALNQHAYPEPYTSATRHCYEPKDITAAYGVDTLQGDPANPNAGLKGKGQTIVLVDSYGSPTAQHDLQAFHDQFYPALPPPKFDQICQPGCKDYKNVGSGQSGSSGADGWAGEANLDIEWAYAMAPLAHIVLVGVPPAETEGVQGFPGLFKEISDQIDAQPAGTVFSMSFGITEETFGGATGQAARFDEVFKKGLRKGDTFLASSGDDGSAGVGKQHRDSVYYGHETAGWPASSPYVTAVGGTQLMRNWRWAPTSDMPYNADHTANPGYFNWEDTPGQTVEPAWNESSLPAATGGGTSILYPVPAWQAPVSGLIAPRNGQKGRGIPDLAWNAAVNGGVLVYTSFFPDSSAGDRVGWHIYGGTSASSPQVAGVVALANEARKDAGEGPIGYLNPVLYGQVGQSAFNDVVPQTFGTTPANPNWTTSNVIDDNQLWDWNWGEDATPTAIPGLPVLDGWDETTGFGTPKAATLVADLAAATPAPAP